MISNKKKEYTAKKRHII